LGGAGAAKEQGALSALDKDFSSCGFDRARSLPAKIFKGAKKAAYYPKTRCSPRSLARRLASPFFLPAASS
jgi:predicted  nucleic acid-binding Zn ribbon protein